MLIFVSLQLAQSPEILIAFPFPLPLALPLLLLLLLPLLPLLGEEAPSADDLLILFTWIVLHLILTILLYQRFLFL